MCVSLLRNKRYFRGPINRGHLIVLGCNTACYREEDTCRLALWCYTLYKTYNYLRHHRREGGGGEGVLELMNGFLREGVGDSRVGRGLVEFGWDSNYRICNLAEESSDEDGSWDLN